MELKNGALALLASAALFLALAIATGGIVFYSAFAAAAAAFALDFGRYASVRYDLAHRLRVDKHLSRTDLLLGSSLTVNYDLAYGGRKKVPLQCRQPAAGPGEVLGEAVPFRLTPGQHSLTFTLTPARRGRQTVPGLVLGMGSYFFGGTMAVGGDDAITVYPPVTVRPARASGRSAPGSVVGNEAVREGSGSDFSHLRAYTPGDSIRHIDWARTSKYGSLVVKDFEDVRSVPVFLLVDADASMETGGAVSELDSAVELATLLAGQVLLENERVGVGCFSSSEVTAFLPLASGQPQLVRIRRLLASVKADRGAREPRGSGLALRDAAAARQAFGGEAGLEAFGAVLEGALEQFTVNAREDGLIKAVFQASRTAGVPCHVVVATNLSMGMSSLLNGVRIARYYGHRVTVALTPHVWYEPREGLDAEGCYRRYREAADSIACLRSQGIAVVELSAAERPEEALRADRVRKQARAVR